jgi:hypothetical protein
MTSSIRHVMWPVGLHRAVRMSALRASRALPRGRLRVFIFVRGSVESMSTLMRKLLFFQAYLQYLFIYLLQSWVTYNFITIKTRWNTND